jgi:hypothetical protein
MVELNIETSITLLRVVQNQKRTGLATLVIP